MSPTSHQDTNHRLALILSLGLHALLLLGAYYWSLRQLGTASPGYSIEFSTMLAPTMPLTAPVNGQIAEQPPAKTQEAAQLAPVEVTSPPVAKDIMPALQDGPGASQGDS